MNYCTIRDLPNTTSKWMKNDEMKTHVFRVFRTRRLKIPVERIPWPYHISRMRVDLWLFAQQGRGERELFQDYFKDCLASIDIDPIEWFYHKDSEKNELKLEKQAKNLMEEVADDVNSATEKLSEFSGNHFIDHMQNRLKAWMAKLENLLRRSPSTFNESVYQDLFQAFVQLFGLSCWPGDVEKFEIPYEVLSEDGSNTISGIRSKPDLILYRHDTSRGYPRARPVAIVEVKGPLLSAGKDRRQEMLSRQTKDTDSSEPRSKRVKFENEADIGDCQNAEDGSENSPTPGTSGVDTGDQTSQPEKIGCQTEQINFEEVHYGELPPHACIPSQAEKKRWNYFLPQLLGEVVAAEYLLQDSNKNCSFGIAVSGYSIIFLNFTCQGKYHFDDIPLKSGAGMDIFISEELCLLKSVDRERISKMLLYLALSSVSSS